MTEKRPRTRTSSQLYWLHRLWSLRTRVGIKNRNHSASSMPTSQVHSQREQDQLAGTGGDVPRSSEAGPSSRHGNHIHHDHTRRSQERPSFRSECSFHPRLQGGGESPRRPGQARDGAGLWCSETVPLEEGQTAPEVLQRERKQPDIRDPNNTKNSLQEKGTLQKQPTKTAYNLSKTACKNIKKQPARKNKSKKTTYNL